MIFTNPHVDIEQLPKSIGIPYLGLQPAHRKVAIWSHVIFWSILLIAIVAFLFFVEKEPQHYALMGSVALLGILSILYAHFSFFKKKYALRSKDVLYKRGLFWQKLTIAPFNRVQHVQINQGPVDRAFDLAKLKIFTAGGSSSDLQIPGLNVDEANKLKDYILIKAGKAADEEE